MGASNWGVINSAFLYSNPVLRWLSVLAEVSSEGTSKYNDLNEMSMCKESASFSTPFGLFEAETVELLLLPVKKCTLWKRWAPRRKLSSDVFICVLWSKRGPFDAVSDGGKWPTPTATDTPPIGNVLDIDLEASSTP